MDNKKRKRQRQKFALFPKQFARLKIHICLVFETSVSMIYVDPRENPPFEKRLRHFFMSSRGRFERVCAGSHILCLVFCRRYGDIAGTVRDYVSSSWDEQALCRLLKPMHGLCRRYVECCSLHVGYSRRHVGYCSLYGGYHNLHVGCYSLCVGLKKIHELLHAVRGLLQSLSGMP